VGRVQRGVADMQSAGAECHAGLHEEHPWGAAQTVYTALYASQQQVWFTTVWLLHCSRNHIYTHTLVSACLACSKPRASATPWLLLSWRLQHAAPTPA
jgi:hypothetical protein